MLPVLHGVGSIAFYGDTESTESAESVQEGFAAPSHQIRFPSTERPDSSLPQEVGVYKKGQFSIDSAHKTLNLLSDTRATEIKREEQ